MEQQSSTRRVQECRHRSIGRQHMESKYAGFLEANPTFQERVEAFTSGLLTPDPKPVVLWSMEERVSYTVGELHQQVKEFVGDRLPISYPAMWSYCRGTGQHPSVLERFGFVANEMDGVISGPFAFEKTAAGADFGDAIAARAMRLCGRLTSKYRSLLRIFGASHKDEGRRKDKTRVCRVQGGEAAGGTAATGV